MTRSRTTRATFGSERHSIELYVHVPRLDDLGLGRRDLIRALSRSMCPKIEPSAPEMKEDDQIKDDDTGDGIDRLMRRIPSWELLKQAAAAERGVRKSFSKAASRVRVARRPKAMKEATTTDSFFAFVFHVQLACVVYALVASFAPKPVGLLKKSGNIGCPRVTLCARDAAAMVLVGLARGSAYFIYPGILLVFATKCNALRTWLGRTFLSNYVPFHDLHALHAALGKVVAWGALVHTVAHVVRWAQAGRLDLLYAHVSGRSGVVAIVAAPLVAVPMAWGRAKRRLSFETRKTLHTVFSVVFGVALAAHAPATRIGAVVGSAVALYVADLVYCMLFKTFKVDTTVFTRLEAGTELTFPNPPGFDATGCYAYVNVPWIARDEWHAFSLYPAPDDPSGSTAICAKVRGDWTRKLHAAVEYDTVRPCFVCGPFTSPFSTATAFDNLALVATGVGITPALAILNAFEATRRVNIIWITRDASMVEFYLKAVAFDAEAFTLVFYTGKRKLRLGALPPTVLVFEKRPDLELTLRTIIWGVETGAGLPEDMVESSEQAKRDGEAFASSLDVAGADADPVARAEAALRRALLASSVDDVLAQFVGGESPAATPRAVGARARAGSFGRDGACDAETLATVLARLGAALARDEAELVVERLEVAEADAAGDGATERTPGAVSREALRAFLKRTAASLERGVRDRKSRDSSPARLEMDDSSSGAAPRKSRDSSPGRVPRAFLCRQDTMDFLSPGATSSRIDRETFLADVDGLHLERWQLLYCGGSDSVAGTLEDFGRDHRVTFRQEKFDW